jgi:hypothetical protein
MIKRIGVSGVTYYRWRKEYGGMRIDQARRLKELEQESYRLKKVVADFALDNAILKEAYGETPKPVPETSDSATRLPCADSIGKTGM